MHRNQKLRLVQEISFMLRLRQPAVSTVLEFYRKFNEKATGNEYANQVIVCSCIYLTSKIFEDERKIRDILNTINCAIKMYQLARAEDEDGGYIRLGKVIGKPDRNQLWASIQPAYQLSMYNELKKQVLEAEQVLLKILKFDFSIAQQKNCNFKQLLSVCDQLRLPTYSVQIAINVYNDLELADDVALWVPGVLYFTCQVREVEDQGKNKGKQEGSQGEGEEAKEKNWVDQIQWEKLFLVPIKKLQAYSERIVRHYEKLTEQENEQQSQPDS